MSTELEYFPPKTSKWQWANKSLKNSPWVCNLGAQMKPKGVDSVWPADVRLTVDLLDGQYVWQVKVTDWQHAQHVEVGTALTAKAAIAAAEAMGESAFRAMTPNWVLMALEAGWRPPLGVNK